MSHSSFYNAQAVAEAIEKIRTLKAQEDWMALKEILLQRVFTKNRHSLGIHNEELYAQTYFGTKMFIHDFVSEVIGATLLIRDAPEEEISKEQKAQFFEEAIAGYGNSALCLSGGGPMGYFHFGVIKALFEAGLLPRIFSGTSAGALVAAIIW